MFGRTMMTLCVALGVALAGVSAQDQQLTNPRLGERAQRALFPTPQFLLPVNTLTGSARVDNAAGYQVQADKTSFPILATLPNQGSSFFITTLKPCGIIIPHVHPRATEQYIIISGTMGGGIAQENPGPYNTTFDTGPGQSFLVPQGLLHYNVNKQCTPLVFIQMFNSADGGTISIPNALAGLNAVDSSTIGSSGVTGVMASPQSAFGLDQECLTRCGLGASGGGLTGLSQEMMTFIGASGSSPAQGPTLPSSG